MSETVEVACQHCGEGIVFEVEDWAQPPQEAYCGEDCYEAHEAPAEATARQA